MVIDVVISSSIFMYIGGLSDSFPTSCIASCKEIKHKKRFSNINVGELSVA
jgi:hypothetical protein